VAKLMCGCLDQHVKIHTDTHTYHRCNRHGKWSVREDALMNSSECTGTRQSLISIIYPNVCIHTYNLARVHLCTMLCLLQSRMYTHKGALLYSSKMPCTCYNYAHSALDTYLPFVHVCLLLFTNKQTVVRACCGC